MPANRMSAASRRFCIPNDVRVASSPISSQSCFVLPSVFYSLHVVIYREVLVRSSSWALGAMEDVKQLLISKLLVSI
jgi:hypothetical protein